MRDFRQVTGASNHTKQMYRIGILLNPSFQGYGEGIIFNLIKYFLDYHKSRVDIAKSIYAYERAYPREYTSFQANQVFSKILYRTLPPRKNKS